MAEPAVLESHTIVIRAGRIVALGPADSVLYDPEEVREIDGTGRFVMPGLVDAHVHLRESTKADLIRYLRAGVTTVRDMNGRPFLLEWRDQIERGDLAGPTLCVASPALGNLSSPREGYPTPQTAEEGRATVRRFHEAGYDLVKVYSFLPATAFSGVMEEAQSLGVPVAGHVPVEVGTGVFGSGVRSIEHLTEYTDASLIDDERDEAAEDLRTVFHAGRIDPARLDSLVQRTVESGMWNVPTIAWFDRNLPTRRVLTAWRSPELRAQGARNRRSILRRLHAADANIAVGTDSDGLGEHLSPFAILDELRAMTESGFTRVEALEAATVGGATLLGGLDDFGTVAPGKRADLLVLLCDPREDLLCLADIEWVVARGQLPVYEVDRQRAEAARRVHAQDPQEANVTSPEASAGASPLPIAEGYATANDGTRLFYRIVGDGPQTVVIPVGFYLEDALARLADDDRRLVFYDPRGRGRSDAVDPIRVSLDHQVSDVEVIRRALGIERMALIGWSGLGMEMAVYAMRHPERVTRLVQVAPVPPRNSPYAEQGYTTRSSRYDEELVRRFTKRRDAGEFEDDPAAHCRALNAVTTPALLADTSKLDEVPDVCVHENEWPVNTGPLFEALLGSFGDYDWRDELRALTVPRLVVHGDEEAFPLEGSREWVRGYENARLLVLRRARHFLFLDRPDVFFPAVERFLDGQWPESAKQLR